MKKGLLFLFVSILSFGCKSNKNTDTNSLKKEKPNVVIIFTDDQGYQDLSCYNSPKIKTPNLDALSATGVKLTDFYVTASVCSASRASLLTGRYPYKNGVKSVFFPDAKGMNSSEITIAEMLKNAGYNTGCFGKWHLGDLKGSLPIDQGFDRYYGIPYSNDMYIGYNQYFSENVRFTKGYNLEKAKGDQVFVKNSSRDEIKKKGIREFVPLFEDDKIIEYPCDQSTLTQRYFDKAINFIDSSNDAPFFAYITPSMPHVPLFASKKFEGTSERGLYGDVIEEIDWYVGKLIKHLKEKGVYNNTMIFFASDNGPWLGYKDHAGSALPLRDGKFTNYEGGVRVPCIMQWPEKWEKGTVNSNIISTLDILPTIAHYTGATLPSISIDGRNIAKLLEGKNMEETLMFYTQKGKIMGVRKGYWKYMPNSGKRNADRGDLPELFNLKTDISERYNVYETYPDIVNELAMLITKESQNIKHQD